MASSPATFLEGVGRSRNESPEPTAHHADERGDRQAAWIVTAQQQCPIL